MSLHGSRTRVWLDFMIAAIWVCTLYWSHFPNLKRITVVVTGTPILSKFTQERWHDGMERNVRLDFDELDELMWGKTYQGRWKTIEDLKEAIDFDLSLLAKSYQHWKVPKAELKVMMRSGKIFRDINVYLEQETSASYCSSFCSGSVVEEEGSGEGSSKERGLKKYG